MVVRALWRDITCAVTAERPETWKQMNTELRVCNSVLLRNHGSSKKVRLLNTTGRRGDVLDDVRAQTTEEVQDPGTV